MRVVMTNDTGSWKLKAAVKDHLIKKGYVILDLGTDSPDGILLYTEAGHMAAKALQNGDADLGVIFCGSGAGVCIAANKHKGVDAVVCESVDTARGARLINDASILCMGANVVPEERAKEMAEVFLGTQFAEDGDAERKDRLRGYIDQIRVMEEF